MIYEGEYLNGKWNGKGKEYNEDGVLIYEGEYLDGKSNGKGKEYDNDGKIVFEGEYLNGRRWNGKGKSYDNYGYLRYEGEFLYDEEINGNLYVNNKLEYTGQILFDKKWNGKGYDKDGNITYELKDGAGKIKEYNYNFGGGLLTYDGEWLNGKKNGKGKEYSYDGSIIFEGEYINGDIIRGKHYDRRGKILLYK